jgi:hypothetical protein
MPKLFYTQLQLCANLRVLCASSYRGSDLSPKIPVNVLYSRNIVKSCFLRTFGSRRPPTAGGSFSRMTAKVLHSQIARNVLTYVDDIIVKSTKQDNHIADLQEIFANFRQAGLKLNPEKCVFGVKKGKFLGCLV